jgi:DNA-binding NtrC family response regulator
MPTYRELCAINFDAPIMEVRKAFERLYFKHLMEKADWKIAVAAKRAGYARTHLYRRLTELGFDIRRRRDTKGHHE